MSCLLRQAESLLLSDKMDGSIYVVHWRPVRPVGTSTPSQKALVLAQVHKISRKGG